MFRRTLNVVYKPIKNNLVILPESYFRVVSSYENGCLCLEFNDDMHYMSWTQIGHDVRDTEIGINSTVAIAIGLKEGTVVKCTLITDVMTLDSVNVSTTSKKDWDMLDASSYRIQNTLLDQTRIVNSGQNLIVWINRAMHLTLKIDSLKPDVSYGKLENNTELHLIPYQSGINKVDKFDFRSIDLPNVTELQKSTSEIITDKHKTERTERTDRPKKQKKSNLDIVPKAICESPRRNSTNKQLIKLERKLNALENLIKDLKLHSKKSFEFRCIPSKWDGTQQMCDLYLTRHNVPELLDINQVYLLQTTDDKEFYVNIKILPDTECFPCNQYPSIEINQVLMDRLEIKAMEKIQLKPKLTVVNFVERIELYPSKSLTFREGRDLEYTFKQYIIDNGKLFPVLINQNQIFKLNDSMVTVKMYPESFKYCLIDCEILKECTIECVDQVKSVDAELNGKRKSEDKSIVQKEFIILDKPTKIIEESVEQIKLNLCLDLRNSLRKLTNILIIGNTSSGKSKICTQILDDLAKKPFYCFSETFHCSRNKGRKPESIHKDLRTAFEKCVSCAPSILVLENLDTLTQNVAEQTQDGEYFNRVSDVIQHLILEYTKDSPVVVIATVTNKNHLNKRIYASRGRHLFQMIYKIPDLETNDRRKIIRQLCGATKKCSTINYKKFAGLTEGYNIGDLIQLVERAVFYAHRLDSNNPKLTDEMLTNSLQTTNSYCLQGIENNNKLNSSDDDDQLNKLPGLKSVISVLEEVLVWPAKFPTIFDNSPLRNQAGVLLFGPPGTGKTYLVSQLAKLWHLRMISVKGPELLAKFIGQSEENVRLLFDKARNAKPCVLFFDEFDSLAPRRGHDSTGVTDRVVNQLLTELDGVEGLQGVVVIAATSRPELLDPALLRSGRIDRLVECPMPTKKDRREILDCLSNSLSFDSNVNLQYFCDKMDNFTGADIQSVLTSANMIAVKERINDCDVDDIPEKILITQQHMLEAFINTRPSLSAQDIIKYRQLYARFTNKEKVSRDFVAKRATLA